MSIIPQEVPTGAIRYNTDSNKMECFNGTKWMQVAVSSPDLNGGARGVNMGGGEPATNIIDFITISTAGNATDFGDLSQTRHRGAAASSRTRALAMGGTTVPAMVNTIDYITIASTGDAINFGDLSTSNGVNGNAGASNQTRGLSIGGFHMTPNQTGVDEIDYVTIATTGDAVDFGDLYSGDLMYHGACASSTRAVVAGGYDSPTGINTIQYITIATTGNSQDFGDMTVAGFRMGAASNSTRGLFSIGETSSDGQSIVDSLQIASTGNSMRFGNLSAAGQHATGMASSTRAVFVGRQGPAPYPADATMDYFAIATEGTAVEFGERTTGTTNSWGACSSSNGHGGL